MFQGPGENVKMVVRPGVQYWTFSQGRCSLSYHSQQHYVCELRHVEEGRSVFIKIA